MTTLKYYDNDRTFYIPPTWNILCISTWNIFHTNLEQRFTLRNPHAALHRYQSFIFSVRCDEKYVVSRWLRQHLCSNTETYNVKFNERTTDRFVVTIIINIIFLIWSFYSIHFRPVVKGKTVMTEVDLLPLTTVANDLRFSYTITITIMMFYMTYWARKI